MLDELRIEAEIVPVVGADADAIAERSGDASAVFLPLRLAGFHLVDPFGSDCGALVGRLPLVALVGAGEAVELGEEPKEHACRRGVAGADGLSVSAARFLRRAWSSGPRARGSRTRGSCEARTRRGAVRSCSRPRASKVAVCSEEATR